jgi:hypothetical protein
MTNCLSPSVRDAGKAVEPIAMPDGTRLLLLPYGARVLGLYVGDDDASFYWNNPLLEDAKTARNGTRSFPPPIRSSITSRAPWI